MGLLRTSSMDRSEPSLVPEWLRGTGHNHSNAIHGGFTRQSTFGNRSHHQPFGNGAFGERVLDRESNNNNNNHYRSYPNFGRGRSADRFDRDREVPVIGRGHEWDWNRERTRTYDGERFQSGFGDGRPQNHHRLPSGRAEVDRPGLIENGEKKFSAWSSNGVDRNASERKLTIRSVPPPISGRTSNLVCKKTPDEAQTEIEIAETPSPSCAHVPKMSEALVHLSSPQAISESQRLEEIALKQSRQLIPMKPALPKIMGSSRDKFRHSKTVTTSDLKIGQPALPYRPSTAAINGTATTNKAAAAPGRLLVLRTSKNFASSLSPVANGSVAALKQQQAVDRKQQPGGDGKSSRDGLAVQEERKPLVHSQNRSDFFNTIRKKAAANGENRNPQENSRAAAEGDDASRAVNELKPAESNGHHHHHLHQLKQAVCGSEEEEKIFLKSLGWVESVEGEDESLTSEEINSFFQKHPKALTQILRNLSGGRLVSPSSSRSDSDDETRMQSS